MKLVDIATTLRTTAELARDPADRAEAQLGLFCVNMLGSALGVQFDVSRPAEC